MKKMLLLAGLSFGYPNVALAQSSVNIYGVVDAGIVPESGGPNGHVTKITGGVSAGSRLGLRSKEELGGNVAVDFVLEAGFAADTGKQVTSNVLLNRQSFMGLKSDYGYVSVGRQYSLIFQGIAEVSDPFGAGSAGRATNILQVFGTRVNNSIYYCSPIYSGLKAEAMYAPGEQAGRSAAGRHYAVVLGYTDGTLATRLIYSKSNDVPGTLIAPINSTRTAALLGSHDFMSVKLHASYAVNKNDTGMDSHDATIGLTYVNGANRVGTSYIWHNERGPTNADVSQIAVGWFYSLSKRINTYLVYARQNRKNAAAASTFFVGNSTETGTGDRAFNLGIKHAF